MQRSRMKRGITGHALLWKRARDEWFAAHPAKTYECYLRIAPSCPRTMTKDETTLDHVKSRGRHPELRYEQSNLRPCCWPCNTMKGSRDLEEVK